MLKNLRPYENNFSQFIFIFNQILCNFLDSILIFQLNLNNQKHVQLINKD